MQIKLKNAKINFFYAIETEMCGKVKKIYYIICTFLKNYIFY